jgi:2-polyprenyl-3-methyl-5-hydroxy-6-metoxy-1,4-benzoquinol methylase
VTSLLRDDCWPLVLRGCADAGLDVTQITNTDATRDALEQRWYAALDSGAPDYGVYGDAGYIAETFACWKQYSRRYLRAISAPQVRVLLGDVRSVVDLGCGIGLTSAALAQIFQCAVYGVDMSDTAQAAVAQRFATRFGFQLARLDQISGADVVFASEFFEHIHTPVAYLRHVLDTLHPTTLIIANSFNTRAIGHFTAYEIDGAHVDPGRMSRQFNAELRRYGYGKVATKFWNNRPAVWRRHVHSGAVAAVPACTARSRTIHGAAGNP